ncbi:MAG: PAS domain-containing protein, partial [Mariprofundaceae bacterium]|nr:PAS domain-containing protein [Mariprofundaceae bacterium]
MQAEHITRLEYEKTQLRESEEKFAGITTAALDAMISIDHNGNVSSWNKAAIGMLGYSEAEALGTPIIQLLAPCRFRDSYIRSFPRFLRTGKAPSIGRTAELACIKKSGETFPAEASLAATQIKGKWSCVCVLRDISERKRSQAEIDRIRDQKRLILEAAGEGIYGLDTRGLATFINPAAAHMLGWKEEELIGKSVHDLA